MEFLIYPACGLVLSAVAFWASNSDSRRFSFYIFYSLGVISFIMSLLLFITADRDQAVSALISTHTIFAAIGFISLVISMAISQTHGRDEIYSRLMEERQLRATSEITQLAASNSNLIELLNYALNKIVTMLGFAGGAIHVFHRAKENLVLGSFTGLSPRLARRMETIEFGDTSIGRTAKNKRLLIIRDLRLSQDYEFFGGKQDGFSYMALVPIVSEGENWGVITLFGKGAYQPGSLAVDILEQFGEQLGAALVLGRRVRTIESSRDSFNSLIKVLGEELCDTTSLAAGPLGIARGAARQIARLFGGDKFEICSLTPEGWFVRLSSESGMDGQELHPAVEPEFANHHSGLITWEQPAPFDEYMIGKSYLYTSLNDGLDWMFIRLEGRRRPVVDYELLSDAFRIIFGLYLSANNQVRTVELNDEISLHEENDDNHKLTSVLARVSGDIEKLIKDYSDNSADQKEMLAWLNVIRQTAKAGIDKTELSELPEEKPKPNAVQIINDAVEEFRHNTDGTFEISFKSDNGLATPSLPPEALKATILEFLTSALFGSGKGSLILTSNGANNAITLELKGEKLAPAPRNAEKPDWLIRIGGRIDCGKLENENGQSLETWRLMIPISGKSLPEPVSHPPIIKVLAIDSQEVIRDLLKGMLAGLEYNSIVVGNSDEALRLVKVNIEVGKPFTHVITDYALDDMTGLELARSIKALEPETYILLISNWGLAPDPELAAKMGVDRILKKPFRMEQLAEIIENPQKRVGR
jgi:CheY-like chemotaxis protein/putative methionine-R-sulfoxide reductase with GAF domain